MNLIGKNVVIYGAGVSGLSAYGLVRERGGKAIIYDDEPGKAHATNSVGIFDCADVIVLSPGVTSDKDFLLDAKLENKIVVSELELASEFCAAEQIAVTGTNGKTTTTMLVDHILRYAKINSHAVGNIGAPFSAIADKLDATEVAVIEASSFQLESALNFSPDIAVLLNITPDHLERHGNMKKYVAAKANIFLKQSERDSVVYNADDKYIAELVPYMTAQKVPFSIVQPVDGAYLSSGFVCYKGEPIVDVSEIGMRGRELENVLAAVAVAKIKGISSFTVASALSVFSRPEFRRQVCAEIAGIKFYNDSKATNVYACLAAAESMDGDTVLILGGAKRNEDFEDLFRELPSSVKAIVATGENTRDILGCAEKANFENIFVAKNLADAAAAAFEEALDSGCANVLFSPASKSFDSFTDYAERGRYFDCAVSKLKTYVSKSDTELFRSATVRSGQKNDRTEK